MFWTLEVDESEVPCISRAATLTLQLLGSENEIRIRKITSTLSSLDQFFGSKWFKFYYSSCNKSQKVIVYKKVKMIMDTIAKAQQCKQSFAEDYTCVSPGKGT